MKRSRAIILVILVAAFLGVGGVLIATSTGGGGQGRTIDISVVGSTMTPAHPTAKLGDTITMSVTADRAEEIHLHGYDVIFQVPKPGATVTRTFKADKAASFEIEIETTSTHLGQFDVSP